MKRFEAVEELEYLRNIICVDTETGEVTEPKTERDSRWCEALDVAIHTLSRLHAIAQRVIWRDNDYDDDRDLNDVLECIEAIGDILDKELCEKSVVYNEVYDYIQDVTDERTVHEMVDEIPTITLKFC